MAPIAPGALIASYRLLRKLGEGGMGAVYEANHEALDRRVAIKVLHPQFVDQPAQLERFFNEARAVNIAVHPGLVQISDCGQTANGTAYLVMEYLPGDTLASRMRQLKRIPEPAALVIIHQLADALAAAHKNGIVHRDLKPSNVMLVEVTSQSRGERVKLLDFGIAKLNESLMDSAFRTRTGMMLGTPTYMSPEQCRGSSQLDGQSDVYSLGVLLFHMLAGAPPFRADNDLVLLNLHAIVEAPSIQSVVPAVSAATAVLLQRMLAKDKDARPSMVEVAQATANWARAEGSLAASTMIVMAPDNTALMSTYVSTPATTVPLRIPGLRRQLSARSMALAVGMTVLVVLLITVGWQFGSRSSAREKAGKPRPSAPLADRAVPKSPERPPSSASRDQPATREATAEPAKDAVKTVRPRVEPAVSTKGTRQKPAERSPAAPNARINPHDIID